MALFGGKRDVSLFKSISRELINDIIQTEIAYYKFALHRTTINVYGEAPGKNYYEPIKLACLIAREDQSWSSDNFGPDINQAINYRFLKQELRDINLIPEVGDLILFRNNFYEVDTKVENQLILGKDPDYALATETVNFGDSFSIIVNTHISRIEKVNLVPFRGDGNNIWGYLDKSEKINGGIANKINT